MFKKAQLELNPIAILMAVVGAVIAWIMAGRMGAGFFYQIITVLATAAVCYVIAWKISDN